MSDGHPYGGIFTPEKCKELTKKIMSIYDGDSDGCIDNMEVPYMIKDCYRAMNRMFNPKPEDVISFSRVLAKNQSKLFTADIENYLMSTFSGNQQTEFNNNNLVQS